jgi:hypothetical protein
MRPGVFVRCRAHQVVWIAGMRGEDLADSLGLQKAHRPPHKKQPGRRQIVDSAAAGQDCRERGKGLLQKCLTLIGVLLEQDQLPIADQEMHSAPTNLPLCCPPCRRGSRQVTTQPSRSGRNPRHPVLPSPGIMSTGALRICSNSPCSLAKANRLTPGERSTSRSTSLSGPSSPRATLPTTRTLDMPCRSAVRLISRR